MYYAEPDAMARKHGAFATPEALCDVVFDVLPETVGDAARGGAQIIHAVEAVRRRGAASMAWRVTP